MGHVDAVVTHLGQFRKRIAQPTLEIVADANHLLPVTHADMLRAHLLRELAD